MQRISAYYGTASRYTFLGKVLNFFRGSKSVQRTTSFCSSNHQTGNGEDKMEDRSFKMAADIYEMR